MVEGEGEELLCVGQLGGLDASGLLVVPEIEEEDLVEGDGVVVGLDLHATYSHSSGGPVHEIDELNHDGGDEEVENRDVLATVHDVITHKLQSLLQLPDKRVGGAPRGRDLLKLLNAELLDTGLLLSLVLHTALITEVGADAQNGENPVCARGEWQ